MKQGGVHGKGRGRGQLWIDGMGALSGGSIGTGMGDLGGRIRGRRL